MKSTKIFSLLLLVTVAACTSKISPQKEESSRAKLVNNLAVDGCDWHLTVDLKDEMGQFLPSDASQSKLDPIIKAASSQFGVYSIDVEITFQLTGKKKSVKCGWGKTGEFDEIELIDIKTIR